MKWSLLKKIYAGIIGNSLFFLSVLAIGSSIPLMKLSNTNFSIEILGALILSISYIIQKLMTPSIIEYFVNYIGYYDHLYTLKDKKALCFIHEFSMLENNCKKTNKLPVFKDNEINLRIFTTIEDYKDVMGEDSALYSLCILKYSFVDHLNKFTRYYLTVSFFVGMALFYFPTAHRIIKIIIIGFSSNE